MMRFYTILELLVLLCASVLLSNCDENDENKLSESIEYLCHLYYKDRLIFSSEVLESGCELECILLKSSGKFGPHFYDDSEVKTHVLEDGFKCDDDKICVNGTCEYKPGRSSRTTTEENIHPPTGSVVIVIYNGTLTDKDPISEGRKSDSFVKIFYDDHYVGSSKVIDEDNSPVWNQSFFIEKVNQEGIIKLIVYDEDDTVQEFVGEVVSKLKYFISNERNGVPICDQLQTHHSSLCYSVSFKPFKS